MRKAPKRLATGGEVNKETNPKSLSPKQWKELNQREGNKPVNGPRPSVYPEYYDPNKWYQEVDDKGNVVDLPYISYTNPKKQIPVDPNHKPQDLSNPSLRFDPNTGKYFNNITGAEIAPIIEQYKNGGKVKGYSTGGGIGFNERYKSVNDPNVTGTTKYSSTGKPKNNGNAKLAQGTQLAGAGLMAAGNAAQVEPTSTQDTEGIKTGIDGAAASFTPWYALAKGASDLGRSQLKKDANGNVVGNTDRAADEWMKPQHEHAIDSYKREGVGGAAKEMFLGTSSMRAVANLAGEGKNKSGFWGKINEFSGNTAINDKIQADLDAKLKAEQDAISQEEKYLQEARTDNALAMRDEGIVNYDDGINSNRKGQIPDKMVDVASAGMSPSFSAVDKFNKKNIFGKAGMVANAGLNKKVFKDGGEIKGAGTGTSDSIEASVEAGSFVVPAKNAQAAKFLRNNVLGKSNKTASLKGGNTDVKLSNGEHIFSPSEVAQLKEEGIDLNALAPEAKSKLRERFNCGGKVKGYAAGGEVELDGDDKDFVKNKRAEIEAQRKADAKTLGEQRAKQLAAEREKALGNEIRKLLTTQLEAKKQADAKYKAAKTKTEALKKSYADYEKESDFETSRDMTSGEKLVGSSSKPKLEDVRKEKEKLLKMIEESEKEENEYKKELDFANNEKNYINDNSLSSFVGPKKKAEEKINIPKVADPLNPTNIEAKAKTDVALGEAEAKKASSSKNVSAPKVDVTFEPNLKEGVDIEVPEAVVKTTATPAQTKPTVTQPAMTEQISTNIVDPPEEAKKGFNWGNGFNAVANYGLPLAQAAIGFNELKKAGPRPVDHIDEDIYTSLNKAKANATIAENAAKFGMTSAEQAQLDNQNNNLTNAGRYAARNYAGGNAAAALNMERSVINDSYGRSLASKVYDNNLKLQKQQLSYARQNDVNNLVAEKQELNRRLFADTMNGWQQNQKAGATLLGAGIQNFIGANRYENEKKRVQERTDMNNNWMGGNI